MIRIAFGGIAFARWCHPWAVAVALAATILVGIRPAEAQVGGPAAPLALVPHAGDGPNAASPPPEAAPVGAALAGALTALVPLAVGGALLTEGDRPDRQRAGTYVVLGGLAAAPWVAQGGSGRWKRALVYGLGSLALSAGAAVTMHSSDVFDPAIRNRQRIPFVLLLTSAFFTAAASVVDALVVSSVRSSEPPAAGMWR